MNFSPYAKFVFTIIFFLSILSITQGLCHDDCSGKGMCLGGQVCSCAPGFGADPSVKESNCLHSHSSLIGFKILRVLFCLLFAFCFVLSILGIIYSPVERASAVINIRKVVLSTIAIGCFINVINWAVDPYGTNDIFHIYLAGLFNDISFAFILMVFITILFHWIELCKVATAAIKKQEMIQKINSKYQNEITVQDVLNKVNVVTKLRIPFAIIVVVGFVAIFVGEGVAAFGKRPLEGIISMSLYFVVSSFVLAIGFLVFGRKLVSLMPKEISQKVRKLTRGIAFTAILMMFTFLSTIVLALTRVYQTDIGFLCLALFDNFIIFVMYLSMLAIYMRINRNFPYVFRSERSSSKDSFHSEVTAETMSRQSSTTPNTSMSHDISIEVLKETDQ